MSTTNKGRNDESIYLMKIFLIDKLLLRGYRTEIDVRNNITDIPLTQEEITDLQVRRENYLNLVVSKLVL